MNSFQKNKKELNENRKGIIQGIGRLYTRDSLQQSVVMSGILTFKLIQL